MNSNSDFLDPVLDLKDAAELNCTDMLNVIANTVLFSLSLYKTFNNSHFVFVGHLKKNL